MRFVDRRQAPHRVFGQRAGAPPPAGSRWTSSVEPAHACKGRVDVGWRPHVEARDRHARTTASCASRRLARSSVARQPSRRGRRAGRPAAPRACSTGIAAPADLVDVAAGPGDAIGVGGGADRDLDEDDQDCFPRRLLRRASRSFRWRPVHRRHGQLVRELRQDGIAVAPALMVDRLTVAPAMLGQALAQHIDRVDRVDGPRAARPDSRCAAGAAPVRAAACLQAPGRGWS